MPVPPPNPGNSFSAFEGGDPQPSDSRNYQREVHFVLQNRYEVVSVLGQGGMGTVYMARDLRLANRYCVVKKLRDDFFREEDKQKAQTFFQREAMVLSQLRHPNIVHILDNFQEDDDYYFVMEYVEGENLHQMLTKRGEPFPEEQVLQWASQIAEVLNVLHSNDPKVIYRDLKPSNIMIDTKDLVKLVDFGIARPYEESDNTHVVSAGYSPPEQYWGAADPRSDIYALGATMYFLLTGQEPLALQTSYPQKINPDISDRTEQIVERATQQDMWVRYQTAPEMKADLDWTPSVGHSQRVKFVETAVVFVVAIMVAGGGTFMTLKLSSMHKEAADKGVDITKLNAKKLDEKEAIIKGLEAKLKAETAKNLEKLRAYQERGKMVPAEESTEPQSIATQPPKEESTQDGATMKQALLAPTKVKPLGIAFKENDEAQLTDPEGLAPLEEDSQRRFKFPFLGQQRSN